MGWTLLFAGLAAVFLVAALVYRVRAVEGAAAAATAADVERRAARLRRILDHLQDGVLVLDEAHRVLYANPAAADLVGAEESLESEGVAPTLEDYCGPVAARFEFLDPDQTTRRVVELPLGGEGLTVLEVTSGPAGDGRHFLLLRDLRGADSVDRKRRDFVSNASHELQTPIAALIGLLDLVDSVPEGEDRQRLLERARVNALSLAQLTRDLLGLARADDPEWRPTPKSVVVRELCEGVLDRLREKAAGKGLRLELRAEPEDLSVLVDPVALQTVVANLVDNAIAYSEEGGVDVTVGRADGLGAVLEVADTGPGIDQSILPRIFERFFRGDPVRSRASGGTGLGLSIVRNLTGRMGGRISVVSHPGQGSVFRLELPIDPVHPLPGAGQAEFKA